MAPPAPTRHLLCPVGCTGTGPVSRGSEKSQPWESHLLPRVAPECSWFIRLWFRSEALTWMDPVTACGSEKVISGGATTPASPGCNSPVAQHGTARQGGKVPSGLPHLILGRPSLLTGFSQAQDQSPAQMPSGAREQPLPCLLSPILSCFSTLNHGRNNP